MTAANFSDRKFGVEIECVGMTIEEVKTLFKNNNVPLTDNINNYSKWSVKDDGSIRGEYVDTQVNCYWCNGTGRARRGSYGGCDCDV